MHMILGLLQSTYNTGVTGYLAHTVLESILTKRGQLQGVECQTLGSGLGYDFSVVGWSPVSGSVSWESA